MLLPPQNKTVYREDSIIISLKTITALLVWGPAPVKKQKGIERWKMGILHGASN